MNLEQETRYILNKYNAHANKGYGQNFLIDQNVVDGIIENAGVCKDDLIIEIGPGLGNLTSPLLENAGKVICIELDPKMVSILKDRFSLYKNFILNKLQPLSLFLNSILVGFSLSFNLLYSRYFFHTLGDGTPWQIISCVYNLG